MSLLAAQTALSPAWISAHFVRLRVTFHPNGG